MKEFYIKVENLSVSEKLYKFINNELIPGTKVSKIKFWKGFDKSVHKLAITNKKLLQIREKIQKAIDAYHIENKSINLNQYRKFLAKIGYIKKKGKKFKIKTKRTKKQNYINVNSII